VATTVLERSGDVARRARRFVTATLVDWGWSDVEVAELLVSELASNAVQHSESTTVGVTVRQVDGAVLVEIANVGAGEPTRQPPDPTRIGGHGLAVVAELARAWGVRRADAATVVWFELAGR